MGRKLDEMVAEKVMGWQRSDPNTGRGGTWVDAADDFMAEAECGTEYGFGDETCQGPCADDCLRFRPSSNAQDANEVLRALKKRGVVLTVKNPKPVNICRAALKAVASRKSSKRHGRKGLSTRSKDGASSEGGAVENGDR